jgi:DNA/RNA-binding domain of Phe-tRNA-synthetase-like protein
MYFRHSNEIWKDYPELCAGVLLAKGISADVIVGPRIARFNTVAESRLAASSEGELPEIQAWRRVFSRMGLTPTQYRCASEALLRRFKKEKFLASIHPLVDLCNAVSLAFAIPVAAFDVSKIAEFAEVRYAAGIERYLAFSRETETPKIGEVIFADKAANAHARRWTNRQSALSAVREETKTVLIVAEAMHASGYEDVEKLLAALAEEISLGWSITPESKILGQVFPQFEFAP